MKKLIAMVAVLAVALTAVACGGADHGEGCLDGFLDERGVTLADLERLGGSGEELTADERKLSDDYFLHLFTNCSYDDMRRYETAEEKADRETAREGVKWLCDISEDKRIVNGKLCRSVG